MEGSETLFGSSKFLWAQEKIFSEIYKQFSVCALTAVRKP